MEGTPKALKKLRISKNLEAKGSSILPYEGLGVGATLGTNENTYPLNRNNWAEWGIRNEG